MNFLDQILGEITGRLFGGEPQAGDNVDRVVGLINQSGGLAAVLQSLSNHGLGNVVESWTKAGASLPISVEMVQQVFGPDAISQFARQLQVSPGAAATELAALLPQAVSRIMQAEGGPAEGNLLGRIMGFLGDGFRGR